MNTIKMILVLLFVIPSLTACTLMRSRDSGYTGYGRGDATDTYSGARYRDLEVRDSVSTELGYGTYQRLSAAEQREVEDRLELKRMERTLQTQRDREQYYRYKPLMKTDRQRIEFIQVGSFEGRQRWARARGISSAADHFSPETQRMIAEQDVSLGMTTRAVRQSWGEPDSVEIAGNPIYGNERWTYTHTTASTEGFNPEKRTIYFESGVVVGWERN